MLAGAAGAVRMNLSLEALNGPNETAKGIKQNGTDTRSMV
jgi:hypothetical protein